MSTLKLMSSDERWMQLAIEAAWRGADCGQSPFAALIVKDGREVAVAHNSVWWTCDSTAHEEILAIRHACAVLGTIDLAGCTIYSTCEPCPMCFSACHWARLSRIVYGSSIADAKNLGFNELTISASDMKRLGGSRIEIVGGCLRAEALDLFSAWLARAAGQVY